MNFTEWCDTQFIRGEDRRLFQEWLKQNEYSLETEQPNSDWWQLWRQFVEAELLAARSIQKS